MKKHYTVAISKGLTIAFGLVLLGSLYFVPYMTGYLDTVFTESSLGWPFTVTVYCCAAVGFGILVFLYRLLCRLDRNVVFVRENANSIRNISICLFLISGICTGYLAVCLRTSALGFGVAFLFLFLGVVMLALYNVFRTAVEMKDEQDYTI